MDRERYKQKMSGNGPEPRKRLRRRVPRSPTGAHRPNTDSIKICRTADAVARALRLALSEGLDVDNLDPAEIVARCEGAPVPPTAAEAAALGAMFAAQWSQRARATARNGGRVSASGAFASR